MKAKNIYLHLISQIDLISKSFLLNIASKVENKDVYLRNSFAKTVSLLKSIIVLFENEQYNEGWILYRSLIDRLVYLHYLIDNNNFLEFDQWTFVKTYEYRHNAKVDERFKKLLKNLKFKTQKGETNEYNNVKNKLNWEKPDPLKVLKSKKLDFIYKFGYDYASMHTHPMSWDGSKEFYQMTKLEPNPHNEKEENLLISSFLISSIILNLIVLNFEISIPKVFIEYLSEIQKLVRGEENNLDAKFKETFEFFKKDAGF